MASLISAVESLFSSADTFIFQDVLGQEGTKESKFGVNGETRFVITPIPLDLLNRATAVVGENGVRLIRGFCQSKFPESQDKQNKCAIPLLQKAILEGPSAVPRPSAGNTFPEPPPLPGASSNQKLIVFALLGLGAYLLYRSM